MKKKQAYIFAVAALFIGTLIGCGNKGTKVDLSPKAPSESSDAAYRGALEVGMPPERPAVGQWFTIDVVLHDNKPTAAASAPLKVTVTTDDGEAVSYKPSSFPLTPGKHQRVQVKINKTGAGIVPIALFADEGYYPYTTEIEVGFQGHLKAAHITALTYDDPAAVNIGIVDSNDKSLAVDAPLEMQVQAVDALLSDGVLSQTTKERIWTDHLKMRISPGARSSPQFQIRSTNIKGGDVHLLATLNLQYDGAVIAQDSFSFSVNPALWLPIVLAILGSLLYGAYNFVQSPKSSWQDILLQLAASVLGGVIAYLFAGFDLLGIKLDPNVLKTYPLLGFLFSYIGIEILLSKRFRPSSPKGKPKGGKAALARQLARHTKSGE